jgi:hypothetical protein
MILKYEFCEGNAMDGDLNEWKNRILVGKRDGK